MGHDPRLAKLLDDIDPDGIVGAAGRAQTEAAKADGLDEIDVELDLSPETAPSYERMVAALEEADDLCRELELLTLAAPPEVADFRRWAAAEIVGQLDARGTVAGAVRRLTPGWSGGQRAQPPTGSRRPGTRTVPPGPSSTPR